MNYDNIHLFGQNLVVEIEFERGRVLQFKIR